MEAIATAGIGCGDALVFPGDVILGDADGVIVIPARLADEIAGETVEMTAFEGFVTEAVGKDAGFSVSIPRATKDS